MHDHRSGFKNFLNKDVNKSLFKVSFFLKQLDFISMIWNYNILELLEKVNCFVDIWIAWCKE